ncbi:MAG: calcium/sodium antiporter [Acidimicrobiaceae bacterium]|nr:calcium/sodium antiporter [Acidimicrobiaceae bacterium]
MTEHLLMLVVALIAIAFSADRFVIGAARTAELLNISPLVIGVVVIGFGTGLPELMTATLASVHDNISLGIGSVMGSTVVNSTLVLGTLGVMSAPKIASSVLKREGISQLFAVTIFGIAIVFVHDRLAYAILLLLLAVFIIVTLKGFRKKPDNSEIEKEAEEVEESYPWNLAKAITIMAGGLVIVLASADLLVSSASSVAQSLGVSKAVIGVTIVALGTSLPEWVTAVAASRRGHSDLVIGNIFGANLFNSTAVAGVAGLISPGQLDIQNLSYEIAFMTAASFVAFFFLSSSRRLAKPEGWILIIVYLAWIVFAIR